MYMQNDAHVCLDGFAPSPHAICRQDLHTMTNSAKHSLRARLCKSPELMLSQGRSDWLSRDSDKFSGSIALDL
eukprot:4818802-Pleurochrysis_carterae.AAC.3